MSIHYFPSPKNESEMFTIAIDNVEYDVHYYYNGRIDAWFFTLTKDDVNVLDNVKLTMGYNFGYNYPDFPLTGNLYLYSPQGYTDAPNKENFGNSVFLVYEDAE